MTLCIGAGTNYSERLRVSFLLALSTDPLRSQLPGTCTRTHSFDHLVGVDGPHVLFAITVLCTAGCQREKPTMRDPVWNVSGGGSGRWLAEELGSDFQIMDDLPAKVYFL